MRTYKRKTSRGSASNQQLNDAAKAVMKERKSVNAASKEYNVKRMTLTRYLAKLTPDANYSNQCKTNCSASAAGYVGQSATSATASASQPGPSTAVSTEQHDIDDNNKENRSVTSVPEAFSPETIRPYPKAGPRKICTAGRRKRKAAILTDTPEKNALQVEQSKTVKKVKKPKVKIDKKKKRVYKKILQSSSDEDDYACLICCETYSESVPGEQWIQCQACKQWSHVKCVASAGLTYVCANCDSDNDDR